MERKVSWVLSHQEIELGNRKWSAALGVGWGGQVVLSHRRARGNKHLGNPRLAAAVGTLILDQHTAVGQEISIST